MKKFFANFFITGMSWLIYNTFFFILYLFFTVMVWSDSGVGAVIDKPKFYAYMVALVVFSVLLIASFVVFFFIGKKYLFKFKNPVFTFLSCFSSYAIIAYEIMHSYTLLAFTRFYLDLLFTVIIFAKQYLSLSLTNAEYWGGHNELFDKQMLVMDLKTSNLYNALFALIPFVIAFLGGLAKKKNQNKIEGTNT